MVGWEGIQISLNPARKFVLYNPNVWYIYYLNVVYLFNTIFYYILCCTFGSSHKFSAAVVAIETCLKMSLEGKTSLKLVEHSKSFMVSFRRHN